MRGSVKTIHAAASHTSPANERVSVKQRQLARFSVVPTPAARHPRLPSAPPHRYHRLRTALLPYPDRQATPTIPVRPLPPPRRSPPSHTLPAGLRHRLVPLLTVPAPGERRGSHLPRPPRAPPLAVSLSLPPPAFAAGLSTPPRARHPVRPSPPAPPASAHATPAPPGTATQSWPSYTPGAPASRSSPRSFPPPPASARATSPTHRRRPDPDRPFPAACRSHTGTAAWPPSCRRPQP